MKKLLSYSERLKHLPRSGWLRKNIVSPETVASHSWQMALMALWLSDKYAGQYDFDKVIKLCLCHDLAESVIGDITPLEKAYDTKAEKESVAISELADTSAFPALPELFAEYEAKTTPESLLANDLDQIDMFVQSLDYEEKSPGKDLSEFRQSALKKIKTELGKKILESLTDKKISSS